MSLNGADIVRRINTILKGKKISKNQFYADCDISSSAYSQWNKGKTFPTNNTITRIAKYLGTTTEYLLFEAEPATKKEPTLPQESELNELQLRAIDRIKNMDPEELRKKIAAIEAVLDM